jgi:hypothetical protein
MRIEDQMKVSEEAVQALHKGLFEEQVMLDHAEVSRKESNVGRNDRATYCKCSQDISHFWYERLGCSLAQSLA